MVKKSKKTILFVCTGNTCRSSMAEVMAKDYLQSLPMAGSDIRIISAGTGALPNLPASPQAQEVMLELNLDLAAHRARLLTKELLAEAALVLTMTKAQQRYVREMLSQLEVANVGTKVHLLKEYALDEEEQKTKEELDILDPFGQSVEVYRACAAELQRYIPQALARFVQA